LLLVVVAVDLIMRAAVVRVVIVLVPAFQLLLALLIQSLLVQAGTEALAELAQMDLILFSVLLPLLVVVKVQTTAIRAVLAALVVAGLMYPTAVERPPPPHQAKEMLAVLEIHQIYLVAAEVAQERRV
jgi:hypothetical protein